MIEELLAMVGGESECAIVPKMRSLQMRYEPRDLAIHGANAGIVQLDNFVLLLLQACRRQIGAVPELIQITSLERRCVPPGKFAESSRGGVVRRMGIHEMEPQKEGTLRRQREPGNGAINNNLCGWKSSQGIDAVDRGHGDANAILKVEIVVKASQTNGVRSGLQCAIEFAASAGR